MSSLQCYGLRLFWSSRSGSNIANRLCIWFILNRSKNKEFILAQKKEDLFDSFHFEDMSTRICESYYILYSQWNKQLTLAVFFLCIVLKKLTWYWQKLHICKNLRDIMKPPVLPLSLPCVPIRAVESKTRPPSCSVTFFILYSPLSPFLTPPSTYKPPSSTQLGNFNPTSYPGTNSIPDYWCISKQASLYFQTTFF